MELGELSTASESSREAKNYSSILVIPLLINIKNYIW